MRDRLAELQAKAHDDVVETTSANFESGKNGKPMKTKKNKLSRQQESFAKKERVRVADMEAFFIRISEARAQIDDIENTITEMNVRHDELLTATTAAAKKECRQRVEALNDSVTATANIVRRVFKELEKETQQIDAESTFGGDSDIRIRTTQQAALSRKFMQVIAKYNDMQATMRRKHRDVVKRQCQVVDPTIDDEGVDRVLEDGAEGVFSGKRLAQAEAALSDIKDRHEYVLKLERSLKDLHQMFLDIAILIQSQGEVLDSIETNMSCTVVHTREALKALKKAKWYQDKARMRKVMIIAGLVIVVIIIGGIAAAMIL